ncbi:MAG: nucleotidyltransferase domain-containing protein [Chloroflexi bacterium]|nr:nucleotidyltransferase domain-containing protein [Chloroflexota bacterium]
MRERTALGPPAGRDLLRRTRERRAERGRVLEAEVQRLLPLLLRWRPSLVLLFGSLARGDVGTTSDIDLLLVMPTAEPFVRRGEALRRELACRYPLDLFIYTPEEFAAMRRDSPLVRHALREGRVLNETAAPG